MFSITFGRFLEISIDKKEVAANSDLLIKYKIMFDEEEKFSYQIGIKGNISLVLLNKTVTAKEESGEVVWNTKNYPAGEYEAYIFISPATYWPSSKFRILQFMDFNLNVNELHIFVYKKSATKTFEIINTGNIPIFVSLSLKGLKSEASLIPMTSNIDVNSSTEFLLSIEKPNFHYNATLFIEVSGGNFSQEIKIPISVYNPVVIIRAENFTLIKNKTNQIVEGILINEGNVQRNLTLKFFTKKGEKIDYILISPNQSIKVNYSFPLDERIEYLEIRFIGSDGDEEVIKKNFGVFKFPKINIYLIITIILIIFILYILFKRKGRS